MPRARAVLVCLCLSATYMLQQSTGAQTVGDFYEGQRVRLLIGYSPGGGHDAYGRLLARHLGKHIPGNPGVIPQNMPGAGSLTLTNYLYNAAPRDGTVLGVVSRGVAMEPLFERRGVAYDATKFSWIGSLNNEVGICLSWHTSDVKRMEDFAHSQLIVGSTGSGGSSEVVPIVLNNLGLANMKVISGYPGSSEVELALERGEVEGGCGWSWSTVIFRRSAWLASNKINILVQFAVSKHPGLPDVPLVMDLLTDDNERSAVELILARQAMGRPILSSPEIPTERLDALRSAFLATVEDPEFIADARRTQLELNPVGGDEIESMIRRLYAMPEDVVSRATELMRKSP